jgi:hypothetical protein
MANASAADVVDQLRRAAYAAEFRAAFGEQIFSTPDAAFERALFALQKYQQEDLAEFAPYTSKYDAFLAGRRTSATQSCAAWRCSTIRRRAIAPRVIRARAVRTARRRCSPTSRMTTSACRATRIFLPTTRGLPRSRIVRPRPHRHRRHA